MTNPLMLRQHATDVATNWWRRRQLIYAPGAGFDEIANLDGAIDAHLDGLREGGELAGQIVQSAYDKAVANRCHDVAADAFVVLALSFLRDDPAVMLEAMNRMRSRPGFADAVDGLFGWFDSAAAMRLVLDNLSNEDALCRSAALAAWHVHRRQAGEEAGASALVATAPDALALHAIGQAGQTRLIGIALTALAGTGPDDARHYAAARSALLLGDRKTALPALQACCTALTSWQGDAMKLVCAALPPGQLKPHLHGLDAHGGPAGLLVQAAGWSGDVAHIPWLLDKVADQQFAVLAGEAFVLITGLDLKANHMLTQAPALSGKAARAGPVPDGGLLRDWWQANGQRYEQGTPYLLGRPRTHAWLRHILATGEQAHRELAALHLALLEPGMPYFPVLASAAIQMRQLERLQGNNHERR
ncbi:hypothetical protein F2P45_15455 [Massilia sp. CCM 8733]|uniref:TIGR02270 family protein n=1 Tax=Massilia mucilaginosa TaxID=2609282 RepID=A0ABX0NUI1_9BURK|nr:hypothetical protein [Massilia mucilaginosa]NHZ90404.1 hypothetical protein [Massilia mucilaginosa]